MLKRAVLIAVFLAEMTNAQAATVIHFSNGPDGSTNISAPWGDYVAVSIGNSLWIGTAEEYQRSRVGSISSELGFREFKVDGIEKNSFVEKNALGTRLTNTEITSINTDIIFDANSINDIRRAKKPKGSEPVAVTWLQNSSAKVDPVFFHKGSGKSFYPYSCIQSQGIHSCEFKMPRETLVSPILLSFSAPHQKPGVLDLKSIAINQADQITRKNVNLGGQEMSDEDVKDFENLHRLDSSISLPVARNNVGKELQFTICGVAAQLFLDRNKVVSYPVNFSISGRKYISYKDRTIYSMMRKPTANGTNNGCLVGSAKLLKNVTQEEPPKAGEKLSVDFGIVSDAKTGEDKQFNFVSDIISVK